MELKLKSQPLNKENISRSVQLINKTNQFNLKTRRMSEEEYKIWSEKNNTKILTFHVEDKYGESGLTGLISAEFKNFGWEIIDFVMSCRVMGKKIEYAMLSEIKNLLGKDKDIKIEYISTQKNKPIRDFISKVASNGLIKDDLKTPEHISVERNLK